MIRGDGVPVFSCSAGAHGTVSMKMLHMLILSAYAYWNDDTPPLALACAPPALIILMTHNPLVDLVCASSSV